MKGLIIKDFYALTRQLWMFLLILVIWAAIPGFAAVPFALVYAAILPVTALAYDERSKWDALAAMMPYTDRDLVLSKYLIGYAAMFLALVFSVATQSVAGVIRGANPWEDGLSVISVSVSLGLLAQCALLPFCFRLGVEKGRLLLYALIVALVLGGMALGDRLDSRAAEQLNLPLLLSLLPLVAAALNAASVFLSVRLYGLRRGDSSRARKSMV